MTSYSDFLAQQAAIWERQLVIKTKACPAAGLTNYTDSIDLWEVKQGYTNSDSFSARSSFPAIPGLADAQTVTATLQISADGSIFTDTAGVVIVTGASGLGSPATVAKFPLATPYQRFHRWKLVTSAGSGDATQVSVTTDVFLG
jgi:hypothetical protein